MQKVIQYLTQELKLKPEDTIIVGVSYGPDSMTLLSLLDDLSKEYGFHFICAHVDHNLRKASKKEKRLLEEWCQRKEIPFETMMIERYGDDNFHNEARNIRYHFFGELVEKYHANYLMTAHHADDLMETILMRIVRGSTLKGYGGFSQEVDCGAYKIVRPLIYVTKKEIESYNRIHRIPYAIDRSNKKNKYTRNRYRKYILPFLKQEDIHVHEKFLKFSKSLEESDQYITKQTRKSLASVYQDHKLSISLYLELDPFLQKKVLYQVLEEIYQDDLMLVSDRHVQLIYQLIISSKKNSFLNMPNNVRIIKSYDVLEVMIETGVVDTYEIELIDYAVLPNGKHLEKVSEINGNGNDICRLSSEEISLPLYVRTRRHGDKMALRGINGHKKIKDIFIDEKIPLMERDLCPIVVDSKGFIVWIPGIKKSKFSKQKNEKYDIIVRYY